MSETIISINNQEISFKVVNDAINKADFDLAEIVYAEGDQEPQAFVNNFRAAYFEKYGKDLEI